MMEVILLWENLIAEIADAINASSAMLLYAQTIQKPKITAHWTELKLERTNLIRQK